jgi:hypothetical protein
MCISFHSARLMGSFGEDMVNTYFLEINEQIRQVSALAGNSIIKSLILEYAIIKQNAVRKKNMSGFSVQLLQ